MRKLSRKFYTIRVYGSIIFIGLILVVGCVTEYPPTISHGIVINNNLRYKYFNDKHNKHLPVAEKLGVKPVANNAEFNNIKSKLTRVKSSRGYNNDAQRPYLVPKAAALIAKIGNDFADSLKVRGLSEYEIIVTSMFRTQKDVENLKSPTKIKNSVHLRGTTFDITYRRYISPKHLDNQQLYAILVNVLVNLKKQGCCYVVQEIESPCFHITVRK
jgi:hypothetical protein